jgi:hemolysin D
LNKETPDPASDPLHFQPSLVRMQNEPPAPLGRAVLWALLALLAGLMLWTTFGQLDIVAVAEGKLVPASYLKIVQPVEQGVVKEILVTEGQEVRAGQVLMRMDANLSEADIKAMQAEYDNKSLALRRIDAQLSGAPLTRRAGDPYALYAQVAAQYQANRTSYESVISQERSVLDKAQNDLAAAQEVKSKLTQILPHYRAQEQAFEKLEKDGFAGRIMFTDKQRERIEKEQDLKAQEYAIKSAGSTIAQSEKKIAQITAEYRRQLQTERMDVSAQFEKAEQELTKQQHRHEYLELKAPQDGTVKDLATHTAGTVTTTGTILMTLVPQDETLRAEVWVSNQDAGFVRTQQPAKIKLAAFTFQKYGMVDGAVQQINTDSSEVPGGAQEKSDNSSRARPATPLAYRALVDLKQQYLEADGVRHRLTAGMQVSAEIKLGTRTVLEYLFSPVTKAFHEAARER